ncbi:hypothetical protein CH302_22285 [Rhodococcus sp. 15-2388-1-1a]|nr:hypothetical protein CH302_22285 [Rhodococcus sp. 15-2388-1-1a]
MLVLGHSGYGTGSPGVGKYECVSISKKCPVGSRKYTPRPPWSVLARRPNPSQPVISRPRFGLLR